MTTGPEPGTVCPYLGLGDDPATHFVFPSHAQRCHATSRASRIEPDKQARDCLTPAHVTCARYRPYVAPVPHGAVRAAIIAEAIEPGQPVRPRHLVRPAATIVAAAVLLVSLAIVGVVLGAQLANLAGGTPTAASTPLPVAPGVAAGTPAPVAATASAGPTTAPTTVPTMAPTDAPTAVPTPTPAATASPGPTPARPTRTPAPTPIVHRVQRGDTLTAIAKRYGVSVAAIMRANGIADPNLIVVGQRLEIPAS